MVSEAAVPATRLIQSGRIYAEIGGGVNTGLAIANPNNQAATISFYFTDATGKDQLVPVGPGLLGRVISALGEPLDGKPLSPDGITGSYPVNAYPPPPLERSLISEPIQLGIRALDGLLTCARGQRVGIFGERGVGKSVLLCDIVTGTDADVAVVALVGERGREVREFIQHQLGAEGLARAVIVVATSGSDASRTRRRMASASSSDDRAPG